MNRKLGQDEAGSRHKAADIFASSAAGLHPDPVRRLSGGTLVRTDSPQPCQRGVDHAIRQVIVPEGDVFEQLDGCLRAAWRSISRADGHCS